MIEKLVLRNFKSYEDSEIEFNSGLNIFLGEVGAGKTSILEAISFALFGRYAGNVTRSELIRRGAEEADVSLLFSTQSGQYKVDRTIHSEKTQKSRLWVFNGESWNLAVEGTVAVSKSIEELLDVDSTTFLASVYASQGEIKEMLETQPGKRRERLDKLLGIDMYEEIWRTLGDARSLVLSELTLAQEKAGGVNVLERQRKELRDRLQKNKEELKMLNAFLREIGDRLRLEEQKLDFFEDLKQKLILIEAQTEGKSLEIESSSTTLRSLKEKVEKAIKADSVFEENKEFIQLERDLESEKRRIESTLQQKRSLETLLQRDSSSLQEAERRRTRLEAQLERYRSLEEVLEDIINERKNLPELKWRQVEFEKKLDEAKANAVKVLNEIGSQKSKVKRIVEIGECPTCLQTVPEEHKAKIKRETGEVVVKLKEDYALLEESRAQVQTQLNDIKKEIELAQEVDRKYVEASTQVRMLKGCEEEIMEVRAQIDEIQARIRDYRVKSAEIKESPENLLEVDKRLQNVALKASLAREAEKQIAVKRELREAYLQEEKHITSLMLQLNELQASKKELEEKYDQKEHKEVEQSVRLLREDQAKTLEATGRLGRSSEEDLLKIKEIEKQLKEKRKSKRQVERLNMENTILEALRRSLRDVVQPVMRKNNVLRVSEAFQGFYQELSNDNIDYATLDEDGNINVMKNGEPSPINSLSGGETTCASLALRLAICGALTRNQLLLLDEPTIHLDELYRAKLREFLSSHSFEQLIVVTHDNTFDSLPAQIFRVEKVRGGSVVSPLIFGGS